MQIFFFSKVQTVFLFIALWLIFQVSAALICLKIPDKYLSPNAPLFKERKWEHGGELYNRVFKVTKWKRYLPDGGAIVKGGYKKKNLVNFSKENMSKYIVESCRAELVHFIAILPFWVFGFFGPPRVILYMLVYALLVNMPCMIAQRYNRPRFNKMLKKIENKSKNH